MEPLASRTIGVGQTIGNYTITEKVGEGGMGVVYKAEHPVIGRVVAIKAIHPELSRNPEVVSRFITEAKSVNQIGNEHIVDIHDFGTTPEGEFYFIMEFLHGESLADRLKREPTLAPGRALQIAAQVADALAASHGHQIIHRDLKPENIFLINRGASADFVKVLDFGLAKLQGEEKVTHKTRTGSVMGTPYYMAPEQCEGRQNIDHRADLYSLGVIVYEMMTGKVPFTGEGYGEIIVKHITQPPPAPRSLNRQITEAQEAVVLRALAKSREDRFQDMAEFRAAMLDPDAYLASEPTLVRQRRTVGALPAGAADEGTSGRVVFGGPPSRRLSPTPTVTERVDDGLDEVQLPRSRKGLAAVLAVAGLAAAGGAVLALTRGGSSDAAAVNTPIAAAPVAPASIPAAARPDKVLVEIESRPDGAEVFRKGSGEKLGTTPLKLELPFAEDRVDVVLRKEGHDDLDLDFVPDKPQTLTATLSQRPVPAAKPQPPRPAAAKPARPPAKPPRKPQQPTKLDEDSVLEPKF